MMPPWLNPLARPDMLRVASRRLTHFLNAAAKCRAQMLNSGRTRAQEGQSHPSACVADTRRF
jgi:hypothetical protein